MPMKLIKRVIRGLVRRVFSVYVRYGRTYIRLWRNGKRTERKLEIGPGDSRIAGFESLDMVPRDGVDYIWDAAKHLPFDDNTFELVYASHVLEHIPWYQVEDVVKEWIRIIRAGGTLEIWVPDGVKICSALVDYETKGINYIDKDGWYKFNPEKDPCKWASGRIFTYGEGTGRVTSPNWHRSLFTPRYLKLLLERAGLKDVVPLTRDEVRGYDHGWINLGMRGIKK